MVRLFVCLWVPKEIVDKIVFFQEKLTKVGLIGKFVERENIHVTIAFIGEVDENNVKEIIEKLENCLNNFSAFKISLEGLKIIPNENFIKIVGINIKGEYLKEINRAVGECLKASFHEDSKLTLCRVKKVQDKRKIKSFLDENSHVNMGEIYVKELNLVKSVLTKNGPKYFTLHKFKLKENEGRSIN